MSRSPKLSCAKRSQLDSFAVDDVRARLLHETRATEKRFGSLDLAAGGRPLSLQASPLLGGVDHPGERDVQTGALGDDGGGSLHWSVQAFHYFDWPQPAARQLAHQCCDSPVEIGLATGHQSGGNPAPGIHSILGADVANTTHEIKDGRHFPFSSDITLA